MSSFNNTKTDINRYLTPFHDSNSMEVYMQEKDGKVHDVIDINKLK